MLYPTPSLTPRDQVVLAEIEQMRTRLGHQLRRAPGKWTAGLSKFLTADAVAASNSIEGFTVSTNDVRDLMEGEHDVDVSEDDRQETLAYQQMMTYVQRLYDVGDFSYSKGQLNAMHWMLQGHRDSPRKLAGQWRRGPVYVTDSRDPRRAVYTAPDAEAVPGLMAELVEALNAPDGAHPLVRAAMAHLNLVAIHPWADGNGRMSRSLQTLVIAREGVLAPEFSSIEAWLGASDNTWEYYRELRGRGPKFQPDQDVSSWVRFNLLAYHQQAQTVQNRFDQSADVWKALAEFVEGRGLDERVLSALHEVAMTARVRRTRYEHAEGLSRQQAQRDLRELVDARLLVSVGNTRARVYTAGPTFPEEILELAWKPFTARDPYRESPSADRDVDEPDG